jgi:hypothetical protein
MQLVTACVPQQTALIEQIKDYASGLVEAMSLIVETLEVL